jgi:hypothetical protein
VISWFNLLDSRAFLLIPNLYMYVHFFMLDSVYFIRGGQEETNLIYQRSRNLMQYGAGRSWRSIHKFKSYMDMITVALYSVARPSYSS